LWIGASDTTDEGKWIWDSTGKPMSPGYQGWKPGYPGLSCLASSYDCALYSTFTTYNTSWQIGICSNVGGGICELQPSN